MNIQHSSRQDSWMTPRNIIGLVTRVLGKIDLDPASSYMANKRICASKYFDEASNGLEQDWSLGGMPAALYVNPPGGKVGNKSKTLLFWQKLMRERDLGHIQHAIFMFFSVEGLSVSQGRDCLPATAFPVCIPRKRIRFDWPGDEAKNAPSHSNAIVYVPGTVDRTKEFYDTFRSIGDIVVPYNPERGAEDRQYDEGE